MRAPGLTVVHLDLPLGVGVCALALSLRLFVCLESLYAHGGHVSVSTCLRMSVSSYVRVMGCAVGEFCLRSMTPWVAIYVLSLMWCNLGRMT